ncbi:MAG: HNH endonuclease [Methylomicrobium sp.]
MTTHITRLLFAQGGQCFFCRKPLPISEASIEHLVASANGGTNEDGNYVACCKTLNHLLGSKSIKEKLHIVLNQRGNFQCPSHFVQRPTIPINNNPVTPITNQNQAMPNGELSAIELVLSDLKKRGASRPRKISTLNSTIKALLKQHKKPNADVDVENLIIELQKRGKLIINETKIAYKLG